MTKCEKTVEKWLINPENNKIIVYTGYEVLEYEIAPRIDRWCAFLLVYTWNPRIVVTLVVDSKSFWKRLMSKLFRKKGK